MNNIGGRLFVWLQYVIPQHSLSRLVLMATRVRIPWFKNLLISGFLRLYSVDLDEAAEPDAHAYRSFNDFFTRPLRDGCRPVAADPAVASPVDGTVSECGALEGGMLLQAKGRRYSLADLTAGQDWAARFEGGAFATIYLAPFNYHRIHMPSTVSCSMPCTCPAGCSASMRPRSAPCPACSHATSGSCCASRHPWASSSW